MNRNEFFRRLSSGALSTAFWVIQRNPKLGLTLAARMGAVAALRPQSWRAPAAQKLELLLGSARGPAMRHIRRQIASLESRNEALAKFVRTRGVDPLIPLVTTIDAEPLLRCRAAGQPIVLVSMHQGPLRSTSMAMRQLGIPTLFGIVERGREGDDADDVVRSAQLSGDGSAMDARFLKRAVNALADGTVVGISLDCAGSGATVPFFGRRVLFGRGAAAIARLGRAKVIPVTRRFIDFGWRIAVTFHEPIEDADLDPAAAVEFEQALLTRAAQCFEAELRRHPGAMRPGRVDWLMMEPLASGGTAPAAAAPRLSARARARLERRRELHRQDWEGKWGSSEFDPAWVGRGISKELRDAVESGWFPPGSAVLDAGCGEGDVSAWLADSGYRVLGVDIATAAIVRAQRLYGVDSAALRFARHDLCERPPDGGPYRVIIDRGCFHQIPGEERPAFAANINAACADDARMIVFSRAFRDGIEFDNIDEIRRRCADLMLTFGPYFELQRWASTYLDRYHGERPDQALPGMVFWLRRRPR